MKIYQAVVLQPVSDCPADLEIMDEDIIGIYSTEDKAQAGINRYLAERRKELRVSDPIEDTDDPRIVCDERYTVRGVELDQDLIYPNG